MQREMSSSEPLVQGLIIKKWFRLTPFTLLNSRWEFSWSSKCYSQPWARPLGKATFLQCHCFYLMVTEIKSKLLSPLLQPTWALHGDALYLYRKIPISLFSHRNFWLSDQFQLSFVVMGVPRISSCLQIQENAIEFLPAQWVWAC